MNTVKEILSGLKSCKAAVVGDFTLDFYITTDQEAGEISIETGLPTLPVRDFRTSPGGAGNVAVNIAALGAAEISVFGVSGDDMFGRELLVKLEGNNIDVSGMTIQKNNWNTNVYTKIINNGIEGKRLDFGNFNSLDDKTADTVISSLVKIMPVTDVLVINQQLVSGLHSPYFRKKLAGLIKKYPETFCITDSRDFPEVYEGSSRKINRIEAAKVLKREKITVSEDRNKDRNTALELYKLWKKPVFLTRGEKGIIVCSSTGCSEIPGIQLLSELDTVGAGDTALSAIAAASGSGFTPFEAAFTGNLASAVTVKKLHTTGTASPEEILSMEKSAVYTYNPELAENLTPAKYWKNSEIEIINTTWKNRDFRFALFDHDGTVSTLRQGWEYVMEPMMTECITGNKDIDSILFEKIRTRVHDFINRTTGLMTLIQMEGLVKLVAEFKLVPENKILSKFEYKKIYNERLMQLVNRRIEKFKKRELSIEDLTVKNSVDFLKNLRERGFELFLASGTDVNDVKQEARLLGYHDIFNGGIFGATKDITNEPKKAVISRIINKLGMENGKRIITFGDGPVEISETGKAGGISVGIASDEVRRYGLNSLKRTRLIKAGADIIIPDYSQMNMLFDIIENSQNSAAER